MTINYIPTVIKKRVAIAADDPNPIEINLKNQVSKMQIVYECVNGNAASSTGHPAKCLTNISLDEGSTNCFSLSGQQTQAVDFYHNKRAPANKIRYLNANASNMIFDINFGRYLYDPYAAWDPTEYENPELTIGIDVDAGGALSAGGYLTVLAWLFDKPIKPVGYLYHEAKKSVTVAATASDYTKLPTDFPIRKLLIQAQKYDSQPGSVIDTVDLKQEGPEKKIIDGLSFDEIIRLMGSAYPPYQETLIAPGTTVATTHHNTATNDVRFMGACSWRSASAVTGVSCYGGAGGRHTEIQSNAGPNYSVGLEGTVPHGVVDIPFGDQLIPEEWYTIPKNGNCQLTLKGGAAAADADINILLQTLKRYDQGQK